RIHFTDEGSDATDEAYLAKITRGLEDGLATFESEGWPRPVPDDGTGGSDAIDVYVVDVDVNGYANPVVLENGDASCYIRIDPQVPDAGGAVASVARHELHHCIQFRYRTDLPSWLYESAATYEQYSHAGDDPLLDFAVGTLWTSRLSRPEQRLGDDRDVYATFLWSKFWAEHTGYDPSRLVDLWEALREGPWPEAMDRAAGASFGQSLDEVFLSYAVHNRFACANDDGQHYLDDPLPCVADVSVPTAPFEDGLTVVHDERRFTAAYFDVPPAEQDEALGIACSGAEGVRTALVTVDAEGQRLATGIEDPWTGVQWVARNPGEEARLVVAGTQAALDATCTVVEPKAVPTGCASVPYHAVWLGLLGAALVRRRDPALPFRRPSCES
ncbi:MAG: hypothetical protein AAF602_21945, partial [Myxococcota bacterium]